MAVQKIVNNKNNSVNKSIRKPYKKRVIVPEVEAPIENYELEKAQELTQQLKQQSGGSIKLFEVNCFQL